MQKFLILALAAALVVCGPAMAQEDPDSKVKVNVVTRSGGVVVKKVIKDGKVVDEDVEVFGDLDDKIRNQIMKMLKEGEKGGCWKGSGSIKSRVFPFNRSFSFQLDDDEDCPLGKQIHKQMQKALKGMKMDLGKQLKIHGFMDNHGDRIRGEIRKALKGLDLHGLHILPEHIEKHIKIFKGKKLPGGIHLFKQGEDDDECECHVFKLDSDKGGKGTSSRGRIRIEMNGKTLMDKTFDSGNAAKKSTTILKKTLRPRIKVQRKMRSGPSSTDETIQKLEYEIQRLQRQLDRLKEELRVRPTRREYIRSRTHQL